MSKIMYNGKAYGMPVNEDYQWTDLVKTLYSGETSLTFQNALITSDRTIEIYIDTYGVNPTNAVITSGQIVLTFSAQANDVGVKIRVSNSTNFGLNAREFTVISTTYTTT